jgi:hypothetical protein
MRNAKRYGPRDRGSHHGGVAGRVHIMSRQVAALGYRSRVEPTQNPHRQRAPGEQGGAGREELKRPSA